MILFEYKTHTVLSGFLALFCRLKIAFDKIVLLLDIEKKSTTFKAVYLAF